MFFWKPHETPTSEVLFFVWCLMWNAKFHLKIQNLLLELKEHKVLTILSVQWLSLHSLSSHEFKIVCFQNVKSRWIQVKWQCALVHYIICQSKSEVPSWFLLENSSVMAWQIGTAPVCLPCHLSSYSCTITLYMWAALATCLVLGPCNVKEKLLCFQGTWHWCILKLEPSSNLYISLYQ